MTLEIVDDMDGVAAAAAARVEQLVDKRDRERFVLALSGGSTPKRFHAVLAEAHAEQIPWAQVDLFLSDERAVAPDDERSNTRMVRETLLAPLGERAPTLFLPDGIADDPVSAAAAYEKQLQERANEGRADLVMLGMGGDGHTASLFPGFDEPTGLIAAVDAPADNVVTRRVSFTYEALARAKDVMVLVSGEGKAEKLAAILERREDFPLTRVLARRNHTIVIADRAAAAQLTESFRG